MEKKRTERIILLWQGVFGVMFFLTSCYVQRRENSGVVLITTKFYDTAIKDYITIRDYGPPQKVWYRDSFAIEEVVGISIKEDSLGYQTRTIAVSYYTFMDLRTRAFYRYASFSDTAAIIKKYVGPDSTGVDGPWNFYIRHGEFFDDSREKPLDTVINDITYKRITGYRIYKAPEYPEDSIKVFQIGYLRCDKKETMFRFTRAFEKKADCPLVRVDDIISPMLYGIHSDQIDFVADKLNSDELKVFDKWQKNAKESPVE